MSRRKPGEPRFGNATIGAIGVITILVLTLGSFRPVSYTHLTLPTKRIV